MRNEKHTTSGHLTGCPNEFGTRRASSRFTRGAGVLTLAAAAAYSALSVAPPAAADQTATLANMIAGARGNCAPLQADSVLTSLAQRATRETEQYQKHLARFEPFEDPMPALRDLGYSTPKAKLLAGYGDVDQKAMDGVVLFGWNTIPDCTYTKYGVDVLQSDGFTVAAAVFAAP